MDAFIGEIRLMAINFTPEYWLPCNGQLLQVAQYQALAAVIGNIFGGNIQQGNFNLPNLNGRTAICAGTDPVSGYSFPFAEAGGTTVETIMISNVPPHTHVLNGANAAAPSKTADAAGNWISGPVFVPSASGPNETAYGFVPTAAGTAVPLNGMTLSPYMGNGGAHENRQPYLALAFFICPQQGIFPVRP